MRNATFTVLAVAVALITALPAGAASTPYRMVPSDRTVLPGQVVTVTVEGPGVERWGGGVNSYFERRRGDGGWQQLYTLMWWGPNRSDRPQPWVTDPTNEVVSLGVQGSPFEVMIPPVKPGVYRITRQFGVDPGFSQKNVTLSTRVTVKPCPKGQRPTFATPVPTGYQYGTPGCTPR